ncbi:MAG: hypothetical protein WCP19_05490, partial [Chloroflexota bacterium]
MKSNKGRIELAFAFITFLGMVFFAFLLATPTPVYASTPAPLPTPSGPDRFTSMNMDITTHEWWLVRWKDKSVECSFFIDHEGLPTDNDIYSACGVDLYTSWINNSTPCVEQD